MPDIRLGPEHLSLLSPAEWQFVSTSDEADYDQLIRTYDETRAILGKDPTPTPTYLTTSPSFGYIGNPNSRTVMIGHRAISVMHDKLRLWSFRNCLLSLPLLDLFLGRIVAPQDDDYVTLGMPAREHQPNNLVEEFVRLKNAKLVNALGVTFTPNGFAHVRFLQLLTSHEEQLMGPGLVRRGRQIDAGAERLSAELLGMDLTPAPLAPVVDIDDDPTIDAAVLEDVRTRLAEVTTVPSCSKLSPREWAIGMMLCMPQLTGEELRCVLDTFRNLFPKLTPELLRHSRRMRETLQATEFVSSPLA